MKKTVYLKSYEDDDDIWAKWALPLYIFSVLAVFLFLPTLKAEPGYVPTLFDKAMLYIIAPPLFAIIPFGVILSICSVVPHIIPWEVRVSRTGQKTERKKIGFITYERPYLTDRQRKMEKERRDQEIREKHYHTKDPVLLKEKEEEAAEFCNSIAMGGFSLMMPLIAALLFMGGEKIPWPGIVRTGSLILAALGGVVLLYVLGKVICLSINKNETHGAVSRRVAYAKCFMCACSGVAMVALPVIIRYTGAEPNVPYPWAEAFQNLKKSWLQIAVLAVILVKLFLKTNNKKPVQEE